MTQRPKRTFSRLADDLHVDIEQVSSAAQLFDEGNSVPFVARYRQEVTGCLTDTQLRQLHRRLTELDTLEQKRDSVLSELASTQHLTEAVRMEIDAADTIQALEEIQQPFKTRRVTKATRAREAGMEPLARRMIQEGFKLHDVSELCGSYSLDQALQQAQYIIAEDVSRLPAARKAAEETLTVRSAQLSVSQMAAQSSGRLKTEETELARTRLREARRSSEQQRKKVAKGLALSHSANDPSTYEAYFKAALSVKTLRPNQIMAINRAEKLGFLTVSLECQTEPVFKTCMALIHDKTPNLTPTSLVQIDAAVKRAVGRLLMPWAERRIRSALLKRAVVDCTATFSRNLWSLLMAPPLVGKTVLGVDPGFKHGCKLCVCSPQGSVLHVETIFPHRGTTYHRHRAGEALVEIVRRFDVEAIALGDGVGSSQTESFIHSALKDVQLTVGWAIVSEDGASVYSASELASAELPDLDVSHRGAVSIARRLQDPLGELVKIDPSHLGVGLYQHDIDASLLQAHLKDVVESAVNTVGVDVNTASPSLLSYVAGLSPRLANNIVQHRQDHGDFSNREELRAVHGIGPKTFQQCAGFLRILNGHNALDNTSVHPESYFVVHQLLEIFIPDRMVEEDVSSADLRELQEVLSPMRRREENVDIDALAQKIGIGAPTLRDIVENILAPGRDVRGHSTTSSLKLSEGVSLENLIVGDKLSGTVKNVVEFGAFVELSAGVTGLIHVQQMRSDLNAGQWVDPHAICKVGDKLSVEIVAMDAAKKRISLKILDHEL